MISATGTSLAKTITATYILGAKTDFIAPSFSGVGVENITVNSADINLIMSENGSIFWGLSAIALTNEIETTGTQETINLTDLNDGENYTIYYKGIDLQGNESQVFSILFETLPRIQLITPTLGVIEVISDTEIKLNYSGIDQNCAFISIDYKLSSAPEWTNFSSVILKNTTNTTVTGLVENSEYNFRINVLGDETYIDSLYSEGTATTYLTDSITALSTYSSRVSNAGGSIFNSATVLELINKLKSLSIFNSGRVGISGKAGKKTTGSVLNNLYCLFSSDDTSSNNTAISPAYDNGLIHGADDSTFKITTKELPSYTDVFIVGEFYRHLFIEHSALATANDGFYLNGSSSSWAVRRTTLNFGGNSVNWAVGKGVAWFRYDATGAKYYFNGVLQSNGTPTGSTVANSLVSTQLNFFSRNQTKPSGGSYLTGAKESYFQFDGLNLSDAQAFNTYLQNKVLEKNTGYVDIIIGGDSQSIHKTGGSFDFVQTNWPTLVARGLGNSNDLVFNNSKGGRTSGDLLTNTQVTWQQSLDKAYDSDCTKHLAAILIGLNDLAGAISVATIQANINAAVLAARNKGYTVIVCTQRPAVTVLWASIQALNASIISNAVANNYTVCDIASNELWFTDGTPNYSSTYYQTDQVHAKQAAHDIFANMVIDTANLILN